MTMQQQVEYTKNFTTSGNVVQDPRIGDSGWVTFTIAHTPQKLDHDTGAWEDGETIYHTVAVDGGKNGRFAQNVLDSITKGLRVNVTGDKKVTPWVKDQQYGLNRVIYAQEVAPSLKFATAQVIPNPKGSNVTVAPAQVTTSPQNTDFGGTYPTYQNHNQQPGSQAGGYTHPPLAQEL